jgi:hypothetical protein
MAACGKYYFYGIEMIPNLASFLTNDETFEEEAVVIWVS